MHMSLSELRELGIDREAWRAADSWGCKESDTTEQLNWTELNWRDCYEQLYANTLAKLEEMDTFPET